MHNLSSVVIDDHRSPCEFSGPTSIRNPRTLPQNYSQDSRFKLEYISSVNEQDVFRSSKACPSRIPKPKPKLKPSSCSPTIRNIEQSAVRRIGLAPYPASTLHIPSICTNNQGDGKSPTPNWEQERFPLIRRKKTCSGLLEMAEKTGAGIHVHWGEKEGFHVHANAPEADRMDPREILLQNRHGTSNRCLSGTRLSDSCRKNTSVRQCIPIFPYAPKLCPKSQQIINHQREARLRELWNKVDLKREGVADLFDLQGIADGLTDLELGFLHGSIPYFAEEAVSRTNKDAVSHRGTLGAMYNVDHRQHTQKPSVDGPVEIKTLNLEYKSSRFPQEDATDVDVTISAKALDEKMMVEEVNAIRLYRRLAREHEKVILLNVDATVSDASAKPMLLVCEKKFLDICAKLLSRDFRSSAINLYRCDIMYACRKKIQKISPEEAQLIFKPHILEYSRILDEKRQKELEKEQDEVMAKKDGNGLNMKPFRLCGDDKCLFDEIHKQKCHRPSRFDEQISHFNRKRLQLEHIQQALNEMEIGEVCTFHPQVNSTPRYLKEIREQKFKGWMDMPIPTEPMEILKQYCSRYRDDKKCEDLKDTIKECTFQPNIHRYVAREAKLQKDSGCDAYGRQVVSNSNDMKNIDGENKLGNNKDENTNDVTRNDENISLDDIFELLDRPFDRILEKSVMDWLDTEGKREIDKDECERKDAGLLENSARRWEMEGREPEHRDKRNEIERCLGVKLSDGRCIVAIPEKNERSCGKKKLQSTNPLNRWKEDLRGGYNPQYMDLSNDKKCMEKTKKEINPMKIKDWSMYIRASKRGVETRVVPAHDLIQDICTMAVPGAGTKLGPTVWNHSRRIQPQIDRGPNASVYTLAITDASVDKICRNSQKNSLDVYKNIKGPTTTFLVPTPPKLYPIRDQYQLYNELITAVDDGEVPVPCRVVALKKDKLNEIEAELLKPDPLICVTDHFETFEDTYEDFWHRLSLKEKTGKTDL